MAEERVWTAVEVAALVTEHEAERDRLVEEHAAQVRALASDWVWEPPGLRGLVDSVSYKPGWTFTLVHRREGDGSGGLALHIVSLTPDSYDPNSQIRVRHAFLVPPATYNRETWVAWIFDRVRDVESHEAGEFFMVEGYREFAPHHGNGEDPYRVWHVGDHVAARKRAGDA